MSKKIGFWSVFALVTGSQIGSGVFSLPSSLAPYGLYSVLGWFISGVGAIALALVFSGLCARFPQTGGPHVYVNKAFGSTLAFFTGWTYWVISWVSTTVVVVASIGYLSPLLGAQTSEVYLLLEIILLTTITALNLNGVKAAGRAEFFLTLLKVLPLLIIPIIALKGFNINHFTLSAEISDWPCSRILSKVMLLTLWGFIGVETATTPAGSVINPRKTIPKAILGGTLCVAGLYIINSIGIVGIVPPSILKQSNAPYVEAAQIIFGGRWHLGVSIIASIVCIGTLNAWMLASSQVALGLAEDKLLPSFFARKNNKEAPYLGLLMSCAGIVSLLILTNHGTLSHQITLIIDFSVIAFLFVYLLCSLSYIRILWVSQSGSLFSWVYAGVAIVFCLWIVYQTSLRTLGIASLFVVSGMPSYFLWFLPKRKKQLF